MDRFTIIAVLVLSILFIAFLIRRNLMDKKSFTKKLNDDYKKPGEHLEDRI